MTQWRQPVRLCVIVGGSLSEYLFPAGDAMVIFDISAFVTGPARNVSHRRHASRMKQCE
jgi:hypothetical protein